MAPSFPLARDQWSPDILANPNLNAYCERFGRAIKEEALEQMFLLGERSLHHVTQHDLAHYHHEWNH
ncbi:MAG: hypothetical protein ACRERE_28985 [Candidatus Entotheonellia bacterium]